MTTPDPAQHLMQFTGGYQFSSAIYVAAELGIADHLDGGPRRVDDLADLTATNADALYRVLRLLAMVGIFEETAPRTFALTPPADLMRKAHPRSMHAMLAFMPDPLHFRIYAHLLDSVRSGKPSAEAALGMPIFDYFGSHPEYAETFNRAMTAISASVIPAVLDAYDFSGVSTLVDVAGGHGEVLSGILGRYPKMRGVLFDVEHVAAGARRRLAAAGLSDRAEAVGGDFFSSVPAGADAYLMQHIIHDWDDARAGQILRVVRTAIGSGSARLLVLDGVVAPGNAPDMLKSLDIEMLLLPGGRERTADEFRALFAAAGFELVSITPTASSVSVLEGRPA